MSTYAKVVIGLAAAILLLAVIGTTVGPRAGDEELGIDLTDIRARLEREADNTTGEDLAYRLHKVEYDISANQISVVLDLQFEPVSEAFLEAEAAKWMDIILHSKSNGKYLTELDVNVLVSFWTYSAPDDILIWGAYRRFSGDRSWIAGPDLKRKTNVLERIETH